jgi:hypothetical protein
LPLVPETIAEPAAKIIGKCLSPEWLRTESFVGIMAALREMDFQVTEGADRQTWSLQSCAFTIAIVNFEIRPFFGIRRLSRNNPVTSKLWGCFATIL